MDDIKEWISRPMTELLTKTQTSCRKIWKMISAGSSLMPTPTPTPPIPHDPIGQGTELLDCFNFTAEASPGKTHRNDCCFLSDRAEKILKNPRFVTSYNVQDATRSSSVEVLQYTRPKGRNVPRHR